MHPVEQVLSNSWDGRPFGHNRHGRKIREGVLCPLGAAGSPCNTMSPGPRPISVPSGILIHSAVWTQYTKVTDMTDRQTDNGPIA